MSAAEVTDLVGVVAWPIVALAAVLLLRAPLGVLVQELGKRATRFSLFEFAIELSEVPEVAPAWKVIGGDDVRQLTKAEVFDSATMSLFQELTRAGASDYIVVDLGSGGEWLTSRLFIFSVILDRMRGMRSVVFTVSRGEKNGVFIGLADTSLIRWRLASAFPWLESAYARAYAEVSPLQPKEDTRFITSDEGALEPQTANRMVRRFLAHIQHPSPAQALPGEIALPVTPQSPDWIELPSHSPTDARTWEHASWLNVDLARRLLPSLDADLAYEDSVDVSAEDRARAIARRSGRFVALVNGNGRFKGLVDRQLLLEAVGRQYAFR